MTVETFFEKFELFADAPDAVLRMRELILHEAFAGRLLPKNAPWDIRTLKSVASKIGSGATPDGGRESYVEIGTPLIRSMNVHFGGFVPKGLVYLTDKQAAELANVIVEPDDVLLNITGASIGRCTTAPREMAGARVNQHVMIIRPLRELASRFLSMFLASPAVQWMINDIEIGATRQALTKGMVERFEIPLPPLAEQKRIVAKVDELMGLCDRLEAQQKEREAKHAVLARAALARFAEAPTPANLEYLFHPHFHIDPADLRKSILSMAVQGKLVEQDTKDEPASRLVERITAEKAALVKQKVIRSSNAHTMRDVDIVDGDLPHGWAWVLVDEITSIGTGGTPLKSEREFYANGNVPWVTSAATNNQFIEAPDQFVTQKAVKECNLRIYPKGSLLIALYGQGKTRGQVGQLMFDSTTNQACAVLEFFGFGEAVRDYIRLFFLKKYDELREQAAGGAQPNLSGGMIRLTRVPLPPLAEQRRIVAKVESLMGLVDRLEAQLAESRQLAARLLAAAVAELTKQE